MATVTFFDAFQYKWAQTGDIFAWDDTQYRLGWATVGSTPPSVEQFNRVHQVADEKANWLYGQLATVATAKGVTLAAGDLTGLSQVLAAYTPNSTETARGLIEIATTAEVTAGADDQRAITPLKLAQRLSALLVQATESVLGIAKIATQAQTNAGIDDATIVTPKKLRNGVAFVMGISGYLTLPSWLGGLIIQWGRGTMTLNTASGNYYTGDYTATLPIPFPSNIFLVLPTIQNTPNALDTISVNGLTTTAITFKGATTNESPQSPTCYWIAFGY